MRTLDEALERFQAGAPEYLAGAANQGPMVAEALVALGHPALLDGWIDVYAARLPPLAPGRAIAPGDRAGARGRPERLADHVATYEDALADRDWRSLLRAELPGLLDGLFASGFQAWLRIAHAVRALAAEETAVRRREVAHGLALLAARYQPLPGLGPAAVGAVPVEERLEAVPVVPEARRRAGSLLDAVRGLDESPAFGAWAAAIPTPADPAACIAAACRAAAARYLAHPAARRAYVPAVTGPAAWRLLAPFLAPDDAARAARRLLQGVGALDAVSRPAPGARPVLSAAAAAWSSGEREDPEAAAARVARDVDEIRYRAATSLEGDAIAMAEACLREHRIAPDPVLCRAAADAALHIG